MSKKNNKRITFDFKLNEVDKSDPEYLSKLYPPIDRFGYDEEAKKYEKEVASRGGFVLY